MAEVNGPSAENLNVVDPRGRIAEAAQGWHRIQLAVLGFIGFCGLFWDGGSVTSRTNVQGLLMVLVALAFLLAIVAIFLVGRVAHAVQDLTETTGADREPGAREARQLRTGVRMTYVAVALVVAATLSAWWPMAAGDDAVMMADATGQTWCGRLTEAPAGQARVATAEGTIEISLDRLVLLRPVGDC